MCFCGGDDSPCVSKAVDIWRNGTSCPQKRRREFHNASASKRTIERETETNSSREEPSTMVAEVERPTSSRHSTHAERASLAIGGADRQVAAVVLGATRFDVFEPVDIEALHVRLGGRALGHCGHDDDEGQGFV